MDPGYHGIPWNNKGCDESVCMYHLDDTCDVTRGKHLREDPLEALTFCHKSAGQRDVTKTTHENDTISPDSHFGPATDIP